MALRSVSVDLLASLPLLSRHASFGCLSQNNVEYSVCVRRKRKLGRETSGNGAGNSGNLVGKRGTRVLVVQGRENLVGKLREMGREARELGRETWSGNYLVGKPGTVGKFFPSGNLVGKRGREIIWSGNQVGKFFPSLVGKRGREIFPSGNVMVGKFGRETYSTLQYLLKCTFNRVICVKTRL